MAPKRGGYVAVLIVSALALPALAAYVGSGSSAAETPAEAAATQTTAVSVQGDAVAVPTANSAPAGDLASEACGTGGLALVALEQDGSITAVQQAALDALRPICEAEGMALPAASPEPRPAAQAPGTNAAAAGSTTTAATAGSNLATAPYDITGGTVVIRYSLDEVFLDRATPADGWSVEIEKDGPRRVEVKFKRDGAEIKFKAFFEHGELQVTVDEKVEGRHDDDHHEREDDDDDEHEDHEHDDDEHEDDD